jgi:hypothetical protein
MSFSFYSPTKHKVSLPLHSESISIGCEAWIDMSRFCAAEKSLSKSAGIHRTFGDHLHSMPSQSSLIKSFADLRRKFRRSSDEDVG